MGHSYSFLDVQASIYGPGGNVSLAGDEAGVEQGGITVTPEGEFLRTFYAKDGYALSLALKKGYRIAIITGGRGKALQVRFDMIGIEHVYTNCHHKLKALHELCGIWSMEPDEIMYMLSLIHI